MCYSPFSSYFLNEELSIPQKTSQSNGEAPVHPLTVCELEQVQCLSYDKALPRKRNFYIRPFNWQK